jgi:hypothetical protein
MNASQDMKSGSSIGQQIRSIEMLEHQRQAVLNAAGVAELFSDAIMWVCRKLQRPRADIFATPSYRYWD